MHCNNYAIRSDSKTINLFPWRRKIYLEGECFCESKNAHDCALWVVQRNNEVLFRRGEAWALIRFNCKVFFFWRRGGYDTSPPTLTNRDMKSIFASTLFKNKKFEQNLPFCQVWKMPWTSSGINNKLVRPSVSHPREFVRRLFWIYYQTNLHPLTVSQLHCLFKPLAFFMISKLNYHIYIINFIRHVSNFPVKLKHFSNSWITIKTNNK